MNFNEMSHTSEKEPLKPESHNRLKLINETNLQLENMPDFQLDSADGRMGLKLALDTVFSNIEQIEGVETFENESGQIVSDKEYEVADTSIIKKRIRDIFIQLYEIHFHNDGSQQEKAEFYDEIEEIMEMIEKRGTRFINDMPEYKFWNQEEMAA